MTKKINSKDVLDSMGMGALHHHFSKDSVTARRLLLRANQQPLYFYKYRQINNAGELAIAKSMIVDGELWLAHKEQLNDPYDLDYQFLENHDIEVRKRWVARNHQFFKGMGVVDQLVLKQKLIYEKFDERMLEASRKNVWDSVGVFCASIDPRIMYMWTHYAFNGSGISVQLSACHEPILSICKEVIYQKEVPTLLLPADDDDIDEVYLKKGVGWSMEKEWRLVLGHTNTVLKIDPRAISGVVIGSEASVDVENILQGFNRERLNSGLPGFKIWKAVRNKKTFGVDIIKA